MLERTVSVDQNYSSGERFYACKKGQWYHVTTDSKLKNYKY